MQLVISNARIAIAIVECHVKGSNASCSNAAKKKAMDVLQLDLVQEKTKSIG